MDRKVILRCTAFAGLILAMLCLYANRSALLVIGAENGNEISVKTALALGANPNARWPRSEGNFDKSALMAAAWSNHPHTALLLITHGADPNLPGPAGVTALYAAVLSNHPQMVRLLLLHGARWDVTYKDGTPLYDSIPDGANPTIQEMLKRAGAPV